MSYILNALRKSEQARKSTQPDAPNASALLPEMPIKSRRRWPMVLVFLGLNLLGLGYLYFKLGDLAQVNVAPLTASAPIVTHQDVAKSDVITTLPVMSSTDKSSNTPAISDWWADNQKLQQAADAVKISISKPKSLVKKPVSIAPGGKEKKPLSKAPIEKKRINPIVADHDDLNEAPEVTSVLSVEPSASEHTIPLLRELSADFQAKVPLTALNVLAYADLPDERFVIVDMVKYKIGERIKAKVHLVGILPESVVMDFEGQRFRLERP